jgi:hypothetical protein
MFKHVIPQEDDCHFTGTLPWRLNPVTSFVVIISVDGCIAPHIEGAGIGSQRRTFNSNMAPLWCISMEITCHAVCVVKHSVTCDTITGCKWYTLYWSHMIRTEYVESQIWIKSVSAISSTMVTMCTTCFNIKEPWVLPTCCIYVTLLATCFMLVSCMAYFSTLKMEATCSSETPVDFQRTTRCYIPATIIFILNIIHRINSDCFPILRLLCARVYVIVSDVDR